MKSVNYFLQLRLILIISTCCTVSATAQVLVQRNYSGLSNGAQLQLSTEATRLSTLINEYFRVSNFKVVDLGLYDLSLFMQGEQSLDAAFQTAQAEVEGQALAAVKQPILRSSLSLDAYLLMVWQVAADGNSLNLRWKLRLPDNGALPTAELVELESILNGMGSQVAEQQLSQLGINQWGQAQADGVKKMADLLERKINGMGVLDEEVMLVKISFRKQYDISDPNNPLSAVENHWLREKGKAPVSYPICYARRASITMLPQITCPADLATNEVRIRATWKNQTSVVAGLFDPVSKLINVTPNPGIVFLNDDYVGVFDSFEVVWELSFDNGKKWRPVGISKNRLYTILKRPIGASQSFLEERLLYFGCTSAQGVTDSSSLVNKIWERFAGRNMSLQWFDPKLSNKTLTYYKNIDHFYNSPDIVLKAQVNDANFEPDGECAAYAHLFGNVLLHQGISTDIVAVAPTELDHLFFLVKNWEFVSARPNELFPYWNQVRDEYIDQDTISGLHEIRSPNDTYNQWIGTVSFQDMEGVPGQGNANPYSDFEKHYIVKIGEIYFDPSYGNGYLNSLQSWEDQAIDGFRGEDVVIIENGKKTYWVRVVKKLVGQTQMKRTTP